METKVVGIRDAKMNLSKLLKFVQDGNEVLLTDRGKSVGKIVALAPQTLSLAERLKKLEERGIIEGVSGERMKKIPPPLPLETALAQKFLQADRDHE